MSTRRRLQREQRRNNPRQRLAELEVVPEAREDEASTVIVLDMAWSGLPHVPSCAGPLLIHEDGSFECHGHCANADGRSALKTWHDLDAAVWPCDATERPPVVEFATRCRRCAHRTS